MLGAYTVYISIYMIGAPVRQKTGMLEIATTECVIDIWAATRRKGP